ncbi:hypothetical protein CK203_039697 [Vitis vinifera]|uniref:Uncharacterized protein n=1 Tax=Vitis vinifera TaxID=29760 RepID=A0A438HTS3_VITVI|nr:hypothetical protein CK203_039697 [Vitis vinifera]
MARTRGAKSSSPSSRKRVSRGAPVRDPTSEPPRPKAVSPPAKPAPQNPPVRRYLTRASPVPSPEPSPAPFPAPSPAPPAEPQELQSPLSEPQIPSEIAPKALIKRPMLTQPPIEGNLTAELDHFTLSCALTQPPSNCGRSLHIHSAYCADTAWSVRDPTLIHFTIDGRHGILGARHIAEALHIPYEPSHFEDYRVWTSPSQLEMVHILSKGASHKSTSVEGELPPSMFLIDALLCHNIYPLQHWTQRRGVLLEALFKISKGYFFGPHHLIMAALLYFEEKVHKKKLQRADAIPLLFPTAAVSRFWSIWGIHQILSWSASAYAERY